MLEWTGERFLPWHNDPALAYEHLHRYFYAAQFVSGKTVLDLASGEGYGTNILAQSAARVVGIDIAADAVEHARARYNRTNIEFKTGSITDIPIAGSSIFDIVVCFEAIEHVENQTLLLDEICRLLKPDGVLLASTPNKTLYNEIGEEENTFHVKELDFTEFRGLLESRFSHLQFLGQRIYAQSNLWPIPPCDKDRAANVVIERTSGEFALVSGGRSDPVYYVAIASRSPLEFNFGSSALIDNGNALLNEKDRELRETKAAAAHGEAWLKENIAERDRRIEYAAAEQTELHSQIKLRDNLIAEQERLLEGWADRVADLQKDIAKRDETIASHEKALAWRANQVAQLEVDKANRDEALEWTTQKLTHATKQLEKIHTSASWKLILRLRVLMPPGTVRYRMINRLVRAVTGSNT